MNQSSITDSIQRLADRTATARGGHAVLLGIRSDDGQTEIRTAAGAAKPDDTFYVASVSKMFTAAIVLGLIDQGELRRTSRLVDLLPHHDLAGLHVLDGVDHTSEVGLGHLLDQTSGLPDYFAGSPALQDDLKQNRDRHYGVSDVLDMVRGTPASFPPGDRGGRRAAYSDTNYQLLTAIIEATTGTDYATAVAQRITGRKQLQF